MSTIPRLRSRPNPWIRPGEGNTVLTYALRTTPSPLTASQPGLPAEQGALELVVTNQTPSAVSVAAIGLTLQFGTGGADLATTTDGIGASISDSTNWAVTPPSETVTSGPALWVVASPVGDVVELAAGASLVVDLFSIPVNMAVGTTTLAITEKLGGGGGGQTSWEITKFPYGFYFGGLVATVVEGSTPVPVAQVPNGTEVTLTWNSSVRDPAAYTVLVSTNRGQQSSKVVTAGQWTSDALVTDTVFVVQVKVTGTGGESLVFALATSVAVQEPDLVAGSVSAGSVSAGSLGVSGMATLSGASVAGTLSAGTVTASSVSATGNVEAETARITVKATVGTLDADYLTLKGGASLGGATVEGSFATYGPVAMLGTPTRIPGGKTWRAPTDGYVQGIVEATTTRGLSVGYLGAWSGGVVARASGGNVCVPVDGGDGVVRLGRVPYNGSLLLPVAKGSLFSTRADYLGSPPTLAFNWIPAGVAPLGLPVETVDDAEPLPPALDQPEILYGAPGRVMDVLAEILGDAMSEDQRARLHRAVEELVSWEVRGG